MKTPELFAKEVASYFGGVHETVFHGDPSANPNLTVEVVEVGWALDTPVLTLIAPWTVAGLASMPDGSLPSSLRIGSRHHPALANTVPEIGDYWSVILIPDVSGYVDQASIRADASELGHRFRESVRLLREKTTQVSDHAKRSMLETMKGAKEPDPSATTAFGDPDDGSFGR